MGEPQDDDRPDAGLSGGTGDAVGGFAPDDARLRRRSVTIAGHRTSVSLEGIYWRLLRGMAVERGLSLNRLVAEVDAAREGNLSSALRLHVMRRLMAPRETLAR